MKFILIIITLTTSMTFHTNAQSQHSLPYSQIPENPEGYTAGNVAARMVDGLGFRYYWATEGLKTSDLDYKPSEEARNLMETLDHLYGLSLTIVNATQQKINERAANRPELTFEEKRSKTLENLKRASELLKSSTDQDIESFKVIFKRGDNQSEFPFWNLINGPISDALWHTGQVVLMRRAAGNPINSKVNVFTGRVND